MFPEDNIDEALENLSESIEHSESVLLCFEFDFDKKEFVIKDGSPELIQEYEATKQWIQKFLSTDIGTLEIYGGYKFGTSYKKMMGSKSINNGYIESEIEREIREGFLLCPSIKKIVAYDSEKQGTKLCLKITVALNSGASAECNATLGV